MNSTRRATVGLVALLVAAAAISIPSVASAGKGCRDGAYCLWTKQNYKGEKLVVRTNALFNFPRYMNNKASSMKNRSGGIVELYDGKNGNDFITCIGAGSNLTNLEQLNNEISSADVSNTC
jgi:hypothetical protein